MLLRQDRPASDRARRALRLPAAVVALSLLASCSSTSAAAPVEPRPGMLAVVGPALSTTSSAGGLTAVERAGRELGYFVDLDAHAQAGIVDPAFRRLPLTYQGGDDADDPYYDLVLVQAGELDLDAPLEQVGIGSRQLLDRLRLLGNPRTRIVLVGPFPSADPVRSAAVRDEMRAAALDKQVPFLDPLALGWSSPREVPQQLATALRRLGLAPESLGT